MFLLLILAMQWKPHLSASLFQLNDGARVDEVICSGPLKH